MYPYRWLISSRLSCGVDSWYIPPNPKIIDLSHHLQLLLQAAKSERRGLAAGWRRRGGVKVALACWQARRAGC